MTLRLNFTDSGRGPPLIVLHGLFGSARNWATIVQALSPDYRVISVDLRNHGSSPWSAEMTYPAMAADLRALMSEQEIGPAMILGHSMGGKVAMALALKSPDLVERLVVADIAPVSYRSTLGDYAEAMMALDLPALPNRAAADEALSKTIAQAAVRSFLLQNLVRQGDQWRWRINLPVLLESMTALSGTEGLDLSTYPGPTLFLRGALSDYIRPNHEATIKRLFPLAIIETIDGAGHWLHAERPKAFLDALTGWLTATR